MSSSLFEKFKQNCDRFRLRTQMLRLRERVLFAGRATNYNWRFRKNAVHINIVVNSVVCVKRVDCQLLVLLLFSFRLISRARLIFFTSSLAYECTNTNTHTLKHTDTYKHYLDDWLCDCLSVCVCVPSMLFMLFFCCFIQSTQAHMTMNTHTVLSTARLPLLLPLPLCSTGVSKCCLPISFVRSRFKITFVCFISLRFFDSKFGSKCILLDTNEFNECMRLMVCQVHQRDERQLSTCGYAFA